MCTDVLILAGGSGERLWPVSNAQKPKQFMTLAEGESFLQSAVRLAFSLNISGDICIVTRSDWVDLVIADVAALAERLQKKELLSKVLIMGEPCGKNTAPAIAWTAKYLLSLGRKENTNILLMASDHIISPVDTFVSDVQTASWYANENNLVSFAIPPLNPATGYGYIKTGAALSCPNENATPSFQVDSFKEKPDALTAKTYLENGNYYWNSGIYAFRADFYLAELAKYSPAVFSSFASICCHGEGNGVIIEEKSGIRIMTSCDGLTEAYASSPSISIDYALSEKCTRSVTVRAQFQWDDVGTWDSLTKYFDAIPADTVTVNSENCFVYSDIPVALCGVEDLVIVIKDGKALVSKRGETNLVKDALGLMKKKGLT